MILSLYLTLHPENKADTTQCAGIESIGPDSSSVGMSFCSGMSVLCLLFVCMQEIVEGSFGGPVDIEFLYHKF